MGCLRLRRKWKMITNLQDGRLSGDIGVGSPIPVVRCGVSLALSRVILPGFMRFVNPGPAKFGGCGRPVGVSALSPMSLQGLGDEPRFIFL